MNYKISLSSVIVPDETYPLMFKALQEEKVGQSEYIRQFENAIAEYVGSKYCIAVSNGTMADAVLVAAMKEMFGIERVIVPALTFIAQPNSVRYNGLQVIFADVDDNWIMKDPPEQESVYSMRDTLMFPVDLMGRVRYWDTTHNRLIVTDACESFGSTFHGRKSGTLNLAGTYSFFPSHTISTGEGGAIVTDNPEIAEMCRRIRSHGSVSDEATEKFTFPYFGFNARMTSMQAVLGIALMKHIDEYVGKRREIFAHMQREVGGFEEAPGEEIVPHGFPVGFQTQKLRDNALTTLLYYGVECRKFFSCIPQQEKQYLQFEYFPNSLHIASTHLYLPCHQNMSAEDVTYIANIVNHLSGRV